ncbi:MAG: FAD-binding oxidoreductase [Bacteroidota bacterium]
MNGSKASYQSYGNVFHSKAELYYPKTLTELRQIVLDCRRQQRRITPAGAFHSFDRQNSGNDVVISLQHFNQITYRAEDHTLCVGPGAKWGDIVEVAYRNKCMVYSCITCSQPTAGGTLSVNSYSMWTPGVGKEGNHCLEIQLMTTEGTLLTCSREQNADLFYGVVSGFGMLGFIVSITYQLVYIGQHFELQIAATDYPDIEQIEERLDLRKATGLDDWEKLRSQSTLFYVDNGQPKFTVYNRRYRLVEQERKGSKFRLYQAVLANGLIRIFPALVNTILKKDARRPTEKRWLLQGLKSIKEGTFWAEPDYYWTTYCSALFRPLGYKTHLYQMTHFIPTGEGKVTRFTKRVYELLAQYQLKFCMFDIMYIPQDEPFVLSTSRYTDGFHVNTTFMDYVDQATLMKFYQQLNQMTYEMGGKIYLAKNCFIEPELLERMHQKEIEAFRQLKERYDPDFVLTSNFFETHFPHYFTPPTKQLTR